jgi:catechol 2,3-dioxygenase-like lactoylglutathione lyase family enzyme
MTGFHHVGLTVQNLEASIDFYSELFGCRVIQRAEGVGGEVETITGLAGAHTLIADLAFPSGHVLELIQYVWPQGRRLEQRTCDPGNTHFCIRVDDIEDAHRRLLARGVTVRSAPVDLGDAGEIWTGAKVLYALDPDGRTIELIQTPQKTGSAS